jgi:hypothetical protein
LPGIFNCLLLQPGLYLHIYGPLGKEEILPLFVCRNRRLYKDNIIF